jgi:hypothetical protein
MCTLDYDSLCLDKMLHILPYHQPPILCWDIWLQYSQAACTAPGVPVVSGKRKPVHSLQSTKNDSSWLHTEYFV